MRVPHQANAPISDEDLAYLKSACEIYCSVKSDVIVGVIARLEAAESALVAEREKVARLTEALRPFGWLCEMHDDESVPDTSGIIFPGSKAVVKMGDLRRARTALAFISDKEGENT